MKHKIMLLITICIILTFSSSAFAHSGGTDAIDGHHDTATGEYHYHHGRQAHLHANGVCPYEIGVFTEDYDSSGGFDVAEYVRHKQIQNQWNALVYQWDNLEEEREELEEKREELITNERRVAEKDLQLDRQEKRLNTLLICNIILFSASLITAVGSFVYIKKHKSNIK